MYSTICKEWTVNLVDRSNLDELYAKTTCTISFSVTLTVAFLVSNLLPNYSCPGRVSTKLKCSRLFDFQVNQRRGTDGETDGRGATLNATS